MAQGHLRFSSWPPKIQLLNPSTRHCGRGDLEGHLNLVHKLYDKQRQYLVCKSCHQSWIWQNRVITHPGLTCKHCGHPWQERSLADLKSHRRMTQWAKWNFSSTGHQWPHRSYKQTFLEPPPGLAGGHRPKKTKVKQSALQRAVQEHWEALPQALKTQCEAIGLQANALPAPPDLPTLIKEHLQSLPSDLKEAVEKLVEPDKPEPTLATKLKQSVGHLKQLREEGSTSTEGGCSESPIHGTATRIEGHAEQDRTGPKRPSGYHHLVQSAD